MATSSVTIRIGGAAGAGDGYGMGLSHLAHAARRNIGIVDVVQNNRVYGLTKGQYSPTSEPGMRTPTSPMGAIDRPVPPLALALQHRGYALIDVLQPRVTFNRASAYDFYNPRVYKLEDGGHDPADRERAWQVSLEWGERIPVGIFYRTEDVPAYKELEPTLRPGLLVERPLEALRAEAM